MPSHWIGMAGIRGCLPSCCDTYETKGQAAESLGLIHELSKNGIRKLRRDCWLDLKPLDGNEYCEIVECTCSNPEQHRSD